MSKPFTPKIHVAYLKIYIWIEKQASIFRDKYLIKFEKKMSNCRWGGHESRPKRGWGEIHEDGVIINRTTIRYIYVLKHKCLHRIQTNN